MEKYMILVTSYPEVLAVPFLLLVTVAPQSRGGADHDPLLVPAKVSSNDGVGDGGAGEPMGEVTGDS